MEVSPWGFRYKMIKKTFLFSIASLFLITGINIILKNWDSRAIVVKAVLVTIFAVVGLVLLAIHDEETRDDWK